MIQHIFTVLAAVLLLGKKNTDGQIISLGCPLGWELNGDSCYQFVFEETKPYDEAAAACWTSGSALVSVNSPTEHNFITNYLNRHGQVSFSEWYTSGQLIERAVKWNGDGSYMNNTFGDSLYWITDDRSNVRGDRIVYQFSGASRKYGWAINSAVDPLNYICEIPLKEVARLVQSNRDFGFGLPAGTDVRQIPRGPKFQTEIENVVIVGSDIPLVLECIASGYPQPAYQWTLRAGNTLQYKEVTSASSNRYTFSNGRLTISNPQETEDAGVYQCKAENPTGSIITAPVAVSFGYLNQFSPNQQGFVTAELSQGTFISCKAPNAKPALTYSWYKDDISNFIRPELNNYFFISANGNLYLSEAQPHDAGNYFCVVTLVARVGEHLSTSQPPSRTSKAIELKVPGSPLDFGPIIHPDFIAVYPKPPLVGHEVRLECFAYGRMPLQYSWSREGKNFPDGTHFMYDNRVMIIPKTTFADSGNYTCKVVKTVGVNNVATKSILLELEAKPYFIFTLRDMHADVGAELTWRCEARAVPRATYTWYRNSTVLVSTPGEIEVRENVLFIKRLDKNRDEGMYQCGATNVHGTSMSTAQLRVLSIKPSFARYPLPDSLVAAQGGNLTIPCQPEAAPQPEITWLQNGQAIGYGDSRRQILIDGTLHITELTFGDQGKYTCKATNANGEDSSSTTVTIVAGVQFQTKPTDSSVKINKTAFLYCDASYDFQRYDLTYMWKFNGRVIDTKTDPFYKDGRLQNMNGLYVVNAQYRHSGIYECIARTVMISLSATAKLLVQGPPTEPAGMFVQLGSGQNSSVQLVWTWNPEASHGFPVLFFQIEAMTEFSQTWTVIANDIPQHLTVLPDKDMKRSFVVQNLLPFNSYRFRVRAKNELGVSPPSKPTEFYRVPAAPPTVAPEIINSGGGSVGLLRMAWKPLSRSEEGGLKFGYKVYWRLGSLADKAFSEAEVGNKTEHYDTVGLDNFYLEYTVKIQAYNQEGYGPISNEFQVFSAEGMPTIRPRNIRYTPINGTAITVTWDPVPNTREAMKGRILGYRIDYEDKNDPVHGQRGSTFVYGDVDRADVIGLEPQQDYWIRVSVFNSAGMSTPSEVYLVNMNEYPPGRFPTFVTVYPHGPNSARVEWRGINIIQGEAPLNGYKMLYWPVGDDIRTANFTMTDVVTDGVIHGLQIDTIYKLRVMGVTRGGDGKKSPTVYFTLLKGGAININRANFDPATSEFKMAAASSLYISPTLLIFVLVYRVITDVFI